MGLECHYHSDFWVGGGRGVSIKYHHAL